MDRIQSVVVETQSITLPQKGKVPLAKPVPRMPTLTAIVAKVQTESGLTGVGFLPHFGPGADLVKQLVDAELTPLLLKEPFHNTDRLFAIAEHHFREVGFPGLPARAYSLIDIACWDLKAQSANLPLAEFLGGARPGCEFFQTETLTSVWDPTDIGKAAKAVMKQGGIGVRVRLGSGDVQGDADRVRELHDACGEDCWIGVNANGKYDLNTALALAHFFEDQGIDWLEDPIPTTDTLGYLKMSERVEIPLAVGSQLNRVDDFLLFIREGFIRIIRPDVTALGGLTPVLKLATVAQSYHVAVSPICSAELGVHLGCGLVGVPHVDGRTWLGELFKNSLQVESGKLAPNGKPGLGLS